MEGHHMIFKIERVQNPELWTKYTQYVVSMLFLPLKNLFKDILFHYICEIIRLVGISRKMKNVVLAKH